MFSIVTVAFIALQGAKFAHANDARATGDACNSGGNVIGITLDTSGSVSFEDVEISKTQVCYRSASARHRCACVQDC